MHRRRLAVVLVSGYDSGTERKVKVKLNLPPGLRARRVLDLAGSEVQGLSGQEKAFEFLLDKFKDGAVVFIELVKPMGSQDEF